MRAILLATVLAVAGLTPHPGVAKDQGVAPDEATVGLHQPTVFRVQPTLESVREGRAVGTLPLLLCLPGEGWGGEADLS
jgi:hypothetical protein